jgi:hypothetical protein
MVFRPIKIKARADLMTLVKAPLRQKLGKTELTGRWKKNMSLPKFISGFPPALANTTEIPATTT